MKPVGGRRKPYEFRAFGRVSLLLLAVLTVSTSVAEAPIEAFARLPTFTDLAVSPGGRFLAARANTNNTYIVSVFEVTATGMKYVYGFRENDELSVDWFRWVSSERLLASIAFTGKRRARRVLQTEERRLVSLDTSTATLIPLFRNKRGELPVQIQDRIVSFLPDDPDHVLVQYSRSDLAAPNVYKVDVTKDSRHKLVQRGRNGILRWTADASGNIRLGLGLKAKTGPILIIRREGETDWRNLSHRVSQPGTTFEPQGFSQDPDKLFVTTNHEGDPSGLYLFDYVTDQFGPLIFKHPSVDISSVNIDEKTSELMSVNFVENDLATKRFSERPIREDIRRLHEQFSGMSLSTRSISADGQHAVVRVRGESDAGRYLLYDGTSDVAIKLPAQYTELDGVPLGRTLATEYVARDGLIIPAYVTLPPGLDALEDARDLPFVIYPHGGPAARDFLRFSFRVQFLVSRGYGVLQMNFRGSSGYGQKFRDAGNREWGQAMQDDITDGAKWLVENNYADPDRLAILGGSYGGYAALMGAVKTPDLYQCAVSFAGVSDLPELLLRRRRYVGGSYATRFIGDLWKDRKMLAANSPARRADEITIPVLLMHGDQDTVVRVDQSKKMAKQLRKHDKDYKFIELEDGDHYLSLYENRLHYLTEVEQFLDACLN